MEWYSVKVQVDDSSQELVASSLFDLGSNGLVFEEGGSTLQITAYFSEIPDIRRFRALLDRAKLQHIPTPVSVDSVEAQDWSNNWRDHFEARSVGEHLFIRPPWVEKCPPDRIVITIDPGMAFGTGAHETTESCLLEIQEAIGRRHIRRAMDLGAGSGILAIALAKLGVSDVVAVEIDSLARDSAESNIQKNECSGNIVLTNNLDNTAGRFDLIVANLFANLLVDFSATLADRLTPNGVLVCSGFVEDDLNRVSQAFEDAALRPTGIRQSDDWICASFSK